MADPLLGPRIKLDRAKHHLIELKRTERDFFQRNPCRIVFDSETQPGHKLAKIVLDASPPEIVHVLTGEIIYQLRSALDQTAVAFARLSKGVNGMRPKPSLVHFPTGDGPQGFKSSCANSDRHKSRLTGNLRYFDCDLRKSIMSTKPYNGGNEVLRAVFRMANIDKHLELIAINTQGGISGINGFTISRANIGVIDGVIGNLQVGVVFSDLTPEGSISPKNAQAKIHVTGQITIGETVESYGGKALVPFLSVMVEEVRRVHNGFEELLIATGRADRPVQRPTPGGGIFYITH